MKRATIVLFLWRNGVPKHSAMHTCSSFSRTFTHAWNRQLSIKRCTIAQMCSASLAKTFHAITFHIAIKKSRTLKTLPCSQTPPTWSKVFPYAFFAIESRPNLGIEKKSLFLWCGNQPQAPESQTMTRCQLFQRSLVELRVAVERLRTVIKARDFFW